jgi:hypothetical protein
LFKLPPYFVDIVRKEVKSFQKKRPSQKKATGELKIWMDRDASRQKWGREGGLPIR